MRIIFFDTETTGKEADDALCQLAITERGVATPLLNELYNPGKPIPFEASAVHHISNTMVAHCPPFQSSPSYTTVKELFESPDTVSVAHNAAFDIGMLDREHIVPARTICSLKVIRAIDGPTPRFSQYKLQYLRYALGMELSVGAHDALADVLVLEQLFDYLLQHFTAQGMSFEEAIAEMVRISSERSLLRDIPFGKYKGQSIAQVAQQDKGYLQWLLAQKEQKPEGEEDWIYTLRHYLGIPQ